MFVEGGLVKLGPLNVLYDQRFFFLFRNLLSIGDIDAILITVNYFAKLFTQISHLQPPQPHILFAF